MDTVSDKIFELEKLIGNTPLVEINFNYKKKKLKIFSKLEYYNYTGSIKDRIALYILKKAYYENRLKKDHTILEATSGNTGISFAAIGKYLGNKVEIYMPDWMSIERKKILQSFGAKVNLISKDKGGFLECIVKTIERSNNSNNVFLPSQFSNEDNYYSHYISTGPEILEQLNKHNLKPNAFISGVGTGGTIMGIGKFFKHYDSSIKIYPLEPSSSPTLSSVNIIGAHRIQGIMDEFIPPILKLKELNSIIPVDDGDAIIMAQKLSSILGLGVGISSGANMIGAIKAFDFLEDDSIVTTVFPDDNKKYLSTDLMNTEPIKEHYVSPNIELTGIRVL